MTPEELESYNIQLEQVNLAISKDPDNPELENLKKDLIELISLTKSVLDAQTSNVKKTESKKAVPKFEIGDHCLAKWAEDGEFYEAVVSAKSNESGEVKYSVIFVGYNNVEVYSPEDLKVFVPQANRPEPSNENDEERKKKKKRKIVPKSEGPSKMEVEQKKKQDAWLKFSNKKSIKNRAVSQKSMFSTADNPNSKVGVINSGKPMTQFAQKEKHKFAKK
ncbi:hypothetical protein K502DRAFT_361715 [Neoconidiobolus thromboides FSU 785]|nr:hypothetical protein K502DRAFT_361715 [Neoconidiobolus thromboides FSU 785]